MKLNLHTKTAVAAVVAKLPSSDRRSRNINNMRPYANSITNTVKTIFSAKTQCWRWVQYYRYTYRLDM